MVWKGTIETKMFDVSEGGELCKSHSDELSIAQACDVSAV